MKMKKREKSSENVYTKIEAYKKIRRLAKDPKLRKNPNER